MALDLEAHPDVAAPLCVAGHARLLATLADLTDDGARAPSRLAGWSVGHLVTHLARNADAHRRRLDGALAGVDVPKYGGGAQQRQREIEAGAGRRAAELVGDLRESQALLEDAFARSAAAGWPVPGAEHGGGYPAAGAPAHRLREVEMHHVDLGLGYLPERWPREYVEWDLGNLLRTVPERLASVGDAAGLTAWLAGRGPLTADLALRPWG